MAPASDDPIPPDWLARLSADDEEVFTDICNAYSLPLYRFVYRYLRDPDIAEDVVQDTLLTLWRQRKRLDDNSTLSGYLYRTARNRALELIRHDRIVQRIHTTHERDDVPARLTGVSDAERAMTDPHINAWRDDLRRVVETLPEHRRTALLLRWEHGLQHDEIAEILGISASTVRKQVQRGLEDLRPLLERLFD